jgi:hypothetical protein
MSELRRCRCGVRSYYYDTYRAMDCGGRWIYE